VPRTPVELPSRREDRAAADAANDLRVKERVAAIQVKRSAEDGCAGQLNPRRARLADVLVARVERDGVRRSQTDEIVEMVRKIDRFDRGAIAAEALLDANVETA
jgi:hypothetical protein